MSIKLTDKIVNTIKLSGFLDGKCTLCQLYEEVFYVSTNKEQSLFTNYMLETFGIEELLRHFAEEGGKIPPYSFYGCDTLMEVEIPDGITMIGIKAFSWCDNLKRVEIPSSVINILEGAFYHCVKLDDPEIPDSVSEIASSVFTDCTNLKYITIPKSVETIGDFAFSDCTCHILFECDKSIIDDDDDVLDGFKGTYEYRR